MSTTDPTATPDDTARREFRVTGMHCESCSSLIEEVLGDLDGITAASVDLEGATAVVTYRPASVSEADIMASIAEAGYTATPAG